jgi:hypothetical protein
MPKYYVKSGQIKYILDRKDHETAIIDTLKAYKNRGFLTGPKVCISENGFDSYKTWKCYDTSDYLKQIKDQNDNS